MLANVEGVFAELAAVATGRNGVRHHPQVIAHVLVGAEAEHFGDVNFGNAVFAFVDLFDGARGVGRGKTQLRQHVGNHGARETADAGNAKDVMTLKVLRRIALDRDARNHPRRQ